MGNHSQLEKQRALAKSVAALLACQLDSQQLEPHHKLLSMVYWLARRPLESAYTPPQEVKDLVSGASPSSSLILIATNADHVHKLTTLKLLAT